MKIFISTSAVFYPRVAVIIEKLREAGHEVIPPNGYGENIDESSVREGGNHADWKEKMLRHDIELVRSYDAVLLLNYEKNGQANYVGASAFLELFTAFQLNKKRFMLNDIPDSNLRDELAGMKPLVIHGDFSLIT